MKTVVNSFVIPAQAGIHLVIALTLVLALAQVGFGQVEVEWSNTYGGRDMDGCESAVFTDNQGYAMAGFSASARPGNGSDYHLVITNARGQELSRRTYGGGNGDNCHDIINIWGEGFILAGRTRSFFLTSRYWLVWTGENGDSLWSNDYQDADRWPYSIIQTSDSCLAMGGEFYDMNHANLGSQFRLIRIDQEGEAIWSRSYGGAGYESCYSIIETEDGGFAMAGITNSIGAGENDFWLVRTDENGEQLWNQSFGGEQTEYCYDLEQTEDGGFILAGTTNSFGEGETDYWLVRTDDRGNELWSRTYGGDGFEGVRSDGFLQEQDFHCDIIAARNGGFVLAGSTTSFGASLNDLYLLRIDNHGDTLWSLMLGGRWNDECNSILQTDDLGFALAGTTESWGAGGSDFWLVKTTPDPVIAHRISLRAGWNLLSSVCPPAAPAMPAVWEQIVGRGNLFITKNQSGRFYRPGVFNGMAPWDVRQGYYARLNEADTLVIVNVPVAVETPIPLRANWNIAAYFPEEPMDVRDAFASIQDDLIMVKSIDGRFYRRQMGYTNMLPLERGKGYQVQVAQAVELIYPNGEQRFAQAVNPPGLTATDAANLAVNHGGLTAYQPSHFQPVTLTGANMSVLLSIPTACGGDEGGVSEIGVFTANGLCVGAALLSTLHSQLLTGIAVWAEDPSTPEIDGAVEGEALGFRLWDGKQEISDLRFKVINLGSASTLAFETDGFAEVNLTTVDGPPFSVFRFHLSSAYPNPFNAATLIRFDLPEEAAVTLTVTDLAGREIARLSEGNYAAGSHSAVWNALNQPSGIYLIKLETPFGVETNKVTIIR